MLRTEAPTTERRIMRVTGDFLASVVLERPTIGEVEINYTIRTDTGTYPHSETFEADSPELQERLERIARQGDKRACSGMATVDLQTKTVQGLELFSPMPPRTRY